MPATSSILKSDENYVTYLLSHIDVCMKTIHVLQTWDNWSPYMFYIKSELYLSMEFDNLLFASYIQMRIVKMFLKMDFQIDILEEACETASHDCELSSHSLHACTCT